MKELYLAIQDTETDKIVAITMNSTILSAIRDAVLKKRNAALKVGTFDPRLAIGLSHTAALIFEALNECSQDRLEEVLRG